MSDLTDYEVLINKIPGIISSRFVTNSDNEIIELHVLANIYRCQNSWLGISIGFTNYI